MCFDIRELYLDTPLKDTEYVHIKLIDIPQEFTDEYDLTKFERAGCIYFAIIQSCCGLKQSREPSNDLLRTKLEVKDYYKTATTTDLWQHNWRSIQCVLVVDDFGIGYMGEEHALHLASILKRYHGLSEEGKGKTLQALTWNGITPRSTKNLP